MPLATIQTLKGVTPDQKRAVIASVTQALATSLDVAPATVRVLVTEVEADAWGVGGVPLSDR